MMMMPCLCVAVCVFVCSLFVFFVLFPLPPFLVFELYITSCIIMDIFHD
jgi:hypothetical protein